MTRCIKFVAIVLAAMFASHCFAIAAFTSQQVAAHEKKWIAHREDLIEIAKNSRGNDVEIAINLGELANRYTIELAHIQDFLLIEARIRGEADRQRVKPVINARLKFVAEGIDLSIKQINLSLAHLNSQALVATATKMRDDLRTLMELLEVLTKSNEALLSNVLQPTRANTRG